MTTQGKQKQILPAKVKGRGQVSGEIKIMNLISFYLIKDKMIFRIRKEIKNHNLLFFSYKK